MTYDCAANEVRWEIGKLRDDVLPAGYTCVGIRAHVSRSLVSFFKAAPLGRVWMSSFVTVAHWSVWWVCDM